MKTKLHLLTSTVETVISKMSFEKYRILVWKNWTIQKRQYISGIFEVILPVLIVIAFTWVRSNFRDDDSRLYHYTERLEPYTSCYAYDDLILKIAYSPTSEWVDEYLKGAFNDTSVLEYESFDNAQALDEYLMVEQPRTVLGIEFDDLLKVIYTNTQFSKSQSGLDSVVLDFFRMQLTYLPF